MVVEEERRWRRRRGVTKVRKITSSYLLSSDLKQSKLRCVKSERKELAEGKTHGGGGSSGGGEVISARSGEQAMHHCQISRDTWV